MSDHLLAWLDSTALSRYTRSHLSHQPLAQPLAFVNKATVLIGATLLQTLPLILQWLEHVAVSFLILCRVVTLFSAVDISGISFPPMMSRDSSCSEHSPSFVVNNDHSDRWEVVSHCTFDWCFLEIRDCQ